MRYAKKNHREFQLRDSYNYFRLFIGSFDNGSLKKNDDKLQHRVSKRNSVNFLSCITSSPLLRTTKAGRTASLTLRFHSIALTTVTTYETFLCEPPRLADRSSTTTPKCCGRWWGRSCTTTELLVEDERVQFARQTNAKTDPAIEQWDWRKECIHLWWYTGLKVFPWRMIFLTFEVMALESWNIHRSLYH